MADVDNDTQELAQYYDRVSDVQYESGLSLIDAMKIRAGDRVLDVGCGTGRLALHVAGVVGPGGSVAGVDPSPHRVQLAAEKAAGVANARFAVGCGEDLSALPDGGFDAIYYSAVFHWIEDKKAALREAYRVLKPGGTVGIYTGCRSSGASTMGCLRQIAARHANAWPDGGTRNAGMWLTKGEMESLLAEARFADATVEQRESVRYFASADDYFLFLRASSFGNRSQAPDHVRAEARLRMAEALEQRRTPQGIEIRSSLLFATARKLP
jgi:ubiquinone/menaquinone biosynthesis C-methylase UbiE